MNEVEATEMHLIIELRMPRWTVWLLMTALCVASFQSIHGEERELPQKKLRVVVVGAHPDDPESCAGGLIISLTRAGHEVIAAYMVSFRSDRKCFGRPEAEVRHKEAEEACKIMGATPKFFPYAAEKFRADETTLRELSTWLNEVKPDVVVAHWPFDIHPNHHAASSLVWQSYRHEGGWNLYLFEAATDAQAIGFHPQLYLDVRAMRATKQQACFCHESQNPKEGFWRLKDQMQRDRGAECGVEYAEGYSLVETKPGCALLPLPFLSRKKP